MIRCLRRFQSWLGWLASLFTFLTEPSPAIEDAEQRRQARLLSALTMLGTVSLFIGMFFGNMQDVLVVVLFGSAYLLSRTRRYAYARWIGALILAMPSFINLAQTVDLGKYVVFARLSWLVFPILFISLVSPVRDTLIAAALTIMSVFSLPLFFPRISVSILWASFGFLVTLTALIAAATAIRHRYFAQMTRHLRQLQAAQAELKQTNKRLSYEVAEREQAEREAAAARDQALEALKLKSQILANVSHDARTPLSVIMMGSEMLKQGMYGDVNSRQKELLDSILLNGKGLLDFFNNLLQESRLGSAQEVSPCNSEIVLEVWLSEFAATIKPLAENKGLALRVVIADDAPQTVFSDPSWLGHILNNLVSNAIKFTDKGTVTICAFGPGSNCWALSVTDTGQGISAAAQAHIFEPFWQVDGSMTRQTSRGVGLGLSIVRQLARLLGGQVEVQSEMAAGSTFTVFLPLEKEANAAEDEQPVRARH